MFNPYQNLALMNAMNKFYSPLNQGNLGGNLSLLSNSSSFSSLDSSAYSEIDENNQSCVSYQSSNLSKSKCPNSLNMSDILENLYSILSRLLSADIYIKIFHFLSPKVYY